MRGPEEWPSCRSNPADRIRLTGPAANKPLFSIAFKILLARLRETGKTMPIKDSLVAATAIVHNLTVATENRIELAKADVPVVDPFVS